MSTFPSFPRHYSIMGTDIQIKMFDDHLVVESPGILPGLVRISNIREFHFSRNPKIVELLTEYEFVKELGEGVDRIYRDKTNTAWKPRKHDGGHESGHQTGHESGHQTESENTVSEQRSSGG